MEYSRRKFITTVAAAGTVMPLTAFPAMPVFREQKKYPISFFTKPLDGFEPEFMAETLAMGGIDSFDLAVRPGGRVEPANVEEELPKVAGTGKKYGLSCDMMVTSIREATRETENVLKTASSCGVKHYRLGYFNYDFKAGIPESLRKIREDLKPLAALNRQYNIQAGYQNHSGTRVGAPVWDVWEMVRDFPVEQISSQYDIRHAVTEGAASWVLGMRLLGGHIGSLAVKDFTWKVENGKTLVVSVPLGEGIVDFDAFFALIRELGLNVPLSLHIEHPFLEKDQETLSLLEKQKMIVRKLKKDVDFIRQHLIKYQLV